MAQIQGIIGVFFILFLAFLLIEISLRFFFFFNSNNALLENDLATIHSKKDLFISIAA